MYLFICVFTCHCSNVEGQLAEVFYYVGQGQQLLFYPLNHVTGPQRASFVPGNICIYFDQSLT